MSSGAMDEFHGQPVIIAVSGLFSKQVK